MNRSTKWRHKSCNLLVQHRNLYYLSIQLLKIQKGAGHKSWFLAVERRNFQHLLIPLLKLKKGTKHKRVFLPAQQRRLQYLQIPPLKIYRGTGHKSLSGSAAKESAPSTSRTPAYQPAPRRPAQPGRFLRSPYIDYGRKELKCSKTASRAYDSVCSATRRSTRSSSQSSSQGEYVQLFSCQFFC